MDPHCSLPKPSDKQRQQNLRHSPNQTPTRRATKTDRGADPKTSKYQREIDKLKRQLQQHKENQTREIPQDFTQFCEQLLNFKLTSYQQEAAQLINEHESTALRWSRQSGKTHLIAAWLLHQALTKPNTQIAVVGPSWRQTKITITKINAFLTKIPKSLYDKPQKTMVQLTNGSTIQAFPNQPTNLRGFTLHAVYADEFGWIPNDQEMYDAILFTLATTSGKFICTSTPGATDTIFYKIHTQPQYNAFAKSHVTWQQALEPNGPMKQKWLEARKTEYEGDPWRWKRELEAEFAEDQATWLPLALITKCIDSQLELWNEGNTHRGTFFAGLDLGKHQDHSALTVIEQKEDNTQQLRHIKVWPLETKYAAVVGYIKTLSDRWQTIEKIRVDITGIGEYIVEDMKNGDIENVEGITFTATRKQELASILKQRMLNGNYKFPYADIHISPTKTLNYATELNTERFEFKKDGTLRFNHPQNQHDDIFWSAALALSCTVKLTPELYLAVMPT